MPAARGEADEALTARIDELVERGFAIHQLPGLAVGVVRDGELVYGRTLGHACVDRQRPVESTTVFRIGSISKTFTAIGVMQLWEQGRFGLDDPVNDHLTAYRVRHRDPRAPAVTIRHLLTHTSGLGHLRSLRDLLKPFGALGVREGRAIPRLRDFYAGGLLSEVYPGTKFAYVNHGFATLGQLIEDVSGVPFAEYMRVRVFEPLGMVHTDHLRSERVRDQLAVGYRLRKSGPTPVRYLDIVLAPAVSMFSTVEDLARCAAALLNGGANPRGRILKPDTVRTMLEPHYQLDPRLPAMGIAFLLGRLGPHAVASHDGGWSGFTSSLLLAPDAGVAVIALTNTLSMPFGGLAPQIMRCLLGVSETQPRWLPAMPARGEAAAQLVGWYGPKKGFFTNAGIYRWTGIGGQVEVSARETGLWLRTPAGPLRRGTALRPSDSRHPDVFEFEKDGEVHTVVFKRDGQGPVESLGIALDRFYRHRRVSGASRVWAAVLRLLDLSMERAVFLVFRVRLRPAPGGRQAGP